MEALIWKTRDKELKIKSLKELFDALANIRQEDLDKEISLNINKEENKLLEWLEQNFPKELDLITGLRESLKEFTPQQMRELLIRKLRKLTL